MNTKTLFLAVLSLSIMLAPHSSLHNEPIPLSPQKTGSNSLKNINQTYTKDNLTVHVKTLKKSELEKTFGFTKAFAHNISMDTSIIPLYITIKNDSNKPCFIEPKDITTSMLSYQELIDFSKNTSQTQKIIKYTSFAGASLLLTGWLFNTHSIFPIFSSAIGSILAVGLTSLVFGAYYGLCYLVGNVIVPFIQNINIRNTIKKNTLQKKVVINPGKEYSTCIFLMNHNGKEIPSISIHSQNKNKTISRFDLDLVNNF